MLGAKIEDAIKHSFQIVILSEKEGVLGSR